VALSHAKFSPQVSGGTPSKATVYFAAVFCPTVMTFKNMSCIIMKAGSVSSSGIQLGIYTVISGNVTRVANTAFYTGTATGLITIPLTSPYTTSANTLYWLAFFNSNNGNATVYYSGYGGNSAAPLIFTIHNQTSLPSKVSTRNIITHVVWVGCS